MGTETRVIVLASQKGGSGKTTLSGHIAVAAQEAGAGPVALIDTDPQGSLAKWWNARKAELPVYVETSITNLAKDIGRLKEAGFKLVVIDTPPAVTAAITDVVQHADLVVVPTRPSPHDLRAVGATVDIVEEADKQMVFVVNCATARARITQETAVSLSQHGTVAPVTVHNRVDFAASMIDGRTVGEVNRASRSAKEIATLWSYLDQRLRKIMPPPSLKETTAPRFEVELLTPVVAATAAEPTPSPAAEAPAPRPSVPEVEVLEPTPVPQRAAEPRAEPVVRMPMTIAEILGLDPDAAPTDPRRVNPPVQEELPKAAIWDGIDRRRRDGGPPSGQPDRRRAPIFGRRPTK